MFIGDPSIPFSLPDSSRLPAFLATQFARSPNCHVPLLCPFRPSTGAPPFVFSGAPNTSPARAPLARSRKSRVVLVFCRRPRLTAHAPASRFSTANDRSTRKPREMNTCINCEGKLPEMNTYEKCQGGESYVATLRAFGRRLRRPVHRQSSTTLEAGSPRLPLRRIHAMRASTTPDMANALFHYASGRARFFERTQTFRLSIANYQLAPSPAESTLAQMRRGEGLSVTFRICPLESTQSGHYLLSSDTAAAYPSRIHCEVHS